MAAITNYSGVVVSTKLLNVVALRTGTYSWGGTPLELYDCGIPYITPPPSAEQIEINKTIAAKHAAESKFRALSAQTNLVGTLLIESTNGDAGAQYVLAGHLLAGQGCETNRARAIYWLSNSAALGNLQASNKLANLPQ
jgi:TPR repeat protein